MVFNVPHWPGPAHHRGQAQSRPCQSCVILRIATEPPAGRYSHAIIAHGTWQLSTRLHTPPQDRRPLLRWKGGGGEWRHAPLRERGHASEPVT